MKRSSPLWIAGFLAAIPLGGCGQDRNDGNRQATGSTARDPVRERAHLALLAGDRPSRLDRAVLSLHLRRSEKDSTMATASLARPDRMRLVLREADEFARTVFVGPGGVLVGTADGPWAPCAEAEKRRLLELAELCAALLGWDLLAPGQDAGAGARTAWTGRDLVRGLDAKGRLTSLRIGERRWHTDGELETAFGVLPARLRSEGRPTIELDRALLDARFRPGLLEPEPAAVPGPGIEVPPERRSSKPSLAEYPAGWDVELGRPEGLGAAIRILTKDIPGPFGKAALAPTGLPVFVEGGGLQLGVRSSDDEDPEAPEGYRLRRRPARVAAFATVETRWDRAPEKLRAVLVPYLARMGLEAKGPLWLSPYLDLGSIREAPSPETLIQVRGEIRVR